MNAAGTRLPLFVVPGGGGTALAFRAVADMLRDQPIVVVEPRGMHQPGPVDRSLDAVVANIRSQIDLRLGPSQTCAILGYSSGGTPAFEVARQLHSEGRSVHLILLDAAPTRSGDNPPTVSALTRLRGRSPADVVAKVRRVIRHRWLVRHPGRPSYDPVRYDAFRTITSRANRGYQPCVLDVESTLLHVSGNTTPERCRPWLPNLEVHQVSGDHHSMLQPPHASELAATLRSVLDSTQRRVDIDPPISA